MLPYSVGVSYYPREKMGGLIMVGRNREKEHGNWRVKNGPGFLYFLAAGALAITILIWRLEFPWRPVALGLFIILVLLMLVFGQVNTCEFDVDRRIVFIRQQRVWKRTDLELPFDKIETVALFSSSSGEGSRKHSVSLVLKSGEVVRLTAHPGSGFLPKKKLAQKISETLNQFRSQPIKPALDGIVRIEREGSTNGSPWSICMITANDATPITQWISKEINYEQGFLLLIPAKSISLSAAGALSKSARFFYKKYLQNLMISESEIPDFKGAILLRNDEHLLGNEFTCISNDPAAAVKWITQSFSDNVIGWMEHSPLSSRKGDKGPHILITPEKAILSLRKRYHLEEQIQHIAEFGVSLIEE